MTGFVALALAGSLYAATPCESLKSLSLPGTTITVAELVPAGPYVPPPAGGRDAGPPAPVVALPAHCRVAAVLAPSRDSHIEIEVWLPAENWNVKFQAVGNGGWAGTISFEVVSRETLPAPPLRRSRPRGPRSGPGCRRRRPRSRCAPLSSPLALARL
jgi:hypothetical protein